MSNNIYDILKKMQNLEAPRQSLAESKKAKPDYIDIDKDGDKTEPMKKAAREKSKGAVAEAVATVERQLAEKYQGFKKSVAEGVQAKGTIKPTDSGEEYTAAPGHRVSATFEPGSTGKPKMGFVKDKSSDLDQTGQGAKPTKPAEKPADQPKVDEDSVRLTQRGFDPYFGAPSGDLDMEREMRPQDDIELKRYRKENPLPKGPGTTVDDYALDRRNLQAAMLYDKYNRAQQLARDRNDLSLSQWAEKGMNKIKSLVTGKPEQPVSYQAYRFDKPGPFGGATARDEIAPPPMKEGEMDESALQAYLGKKKYGPEGMEALQQAGREGASKEKMARIRAQHDKMDEGMADFDDNYGSPEIDRVMSRQGSEDFSKKSERQRELDAVERIGAMMHDEREQRAYKDRTAPGIINKVKDYFDYDKPNPAYGPKFKDKQGTEYDYPYGNPKTKSYNEDMLSSKEKSFAALAEPKDKITYADKIAGAKKGVKKEGNRFTAGLANDNVKVGEKIPGTNAIKTKDIDEGQSDGPEYQAAWKRTQDERKAWEKSNPGEKYYGSSKSPVERHDMELQKARAADQATKDAGRSPLGRVANTLSRGLFGQELPEGRTSMREGWEEMQKYLDKKHGPQSKGGAGKKAGTRYGGSAQKDDDEATDGEGKPVEKKKGRPKGTGGGAKFSFKKPKD